MAAHGLDAEPARLAGIASRYGLAHAAALIGAWIMLALAAAFALCRRARQVDQ